MSDVTRRKWYTFAAAGTAAAALVVGLGAAGAIAASRILSPSEESKAVIDDAAKQLGVQPEELSDALKQALKNRIDDAVDAGRLTEEQAKELEERIDSGDYPLLFGHGLGPGHGFGLGHHRGFGVLETAAAYLGLSEADLREALGDKTLAEIAQEKGKTVDALVKALVAAEEKDRRGGRRWPHHEGPGDGDQVEADRAHGSARQRRAATGRPPAPRVLARVGLAARTTTVFRRSAGIAGQATRRGRTRSDPVLLKAQLKD